MAKRNAAKGRVEASLLLLLLLLLLLYLVPLGNSVHGVDVLLQITG